MGLCPFSMLTHRLVQWPEAPIGVKTRTDVLLKRSDNSLVAFGDEAFKKYTDMDTKEQKECRLFQKFKMCLFGDVKLRPRIKDVAGEEIEALPVFAAGLEAMKKTVMSRLDESNRYGATEYDVQCAYRCTIAIFLFAVHQRSS